MSNSKKIKICPRCHRELPPRAMKCPWENCGIPLAGQPKLFKSIPTSRVISKTSKKVENDKSSIIFMDGIEPHDPTQQD